MSIRALMSIVKEKDTAEAKVTYLETGIEVVAAALECGVIGPTEAVERLRSLAKTKVQQEVTQP